MFVFEFVLVFVWFVLLVVVIDKFVYFVFSNFGLVGLLVEKGIGIVVVLGVEIDVCVLLMVMSVVDFGFCIVIVEDVLCSLFDIGYDVLMMMYCICFYG